MYGRSASCLCGIKCFSPAFFAREDTRTPMNYALISIAINTGLALVLFPRYGFLAVAFATSFASWVQVAMLGWTLHRRGLFAPDARLLNRAPRILAATIGLAGFADFALSHADAIAVFLFNRYWLGVVMIAVAGLFVYIALLLALGGVRLSDYKAYARNRASL
ncbi:MAG: lipid II flippase MurJ [Parvularculaceae bacterium]